MLFHARCAHGWSGLAPSVSCDRCGNTCSSFSSMVELVMHHESAHEFVADCVQLTFRSENEFLLWKKKEEEEGGVSYICNLKKVEGASGASMQSYRCYQHKGEDKRGLPASHRQCNSSGQHCLSVMLKVINADGIKVTYQKNHYRHEGRHPTSGKPVTGQPPLASPDGAVSSVVGPGSLCSGRRTWLLVKEEEFLLWKKKEEEKEGVSYICNLKKVEGASGASMQSYRCYQHKGEDKRGLPASHRQCNSSGQHCLSVMLKVINADGIKVTYQKNHYRHEGRHPTSGKPVTGQPPLASPDEAVSSVVGPGSPCSGRRTWLLVKEEGKFMSVRVSEGREGGEGREGREGGEGGEGREGREGGEWREGYECVRAVRAVRLVRAVRAVRAMRAVMAMRAVSA
ncbi:uncharacterized protein ISCGN_017398 [Ixodes scapularis]